VAAIGARRILLLGTEVTYDAFGNPTYAITGVTAGVSVPVDCLGWGAVKIYLRSIGTTSGGTVAIEEADWGPWEAPYSGTWSQVVTAIAASTFTGGKQLATVVPLSANRFIRVNITGAITGGGTIIASMVMQEAA
jgi:hypothetical protein